MIYIAQDARREIITTGLDLVRMESDLQEFADLGEAQNSGPTIHFVITGYDGPFIVETHHVYGRKPSKVG